MDQELGIAIIGCGFIGRVHLGALQTLKERGLKGFRVSALCDVLQERAESLASEMAGRAPDATPKVYADYRHMLDEETADVVSICTSVGVHHTIAVDCLNSGLHVMVEKPLAISVKAGRLMCETAERTGRALAVAERVRYMESTRHAKWALDQGYIGSLQMTAFGGVGSAAFGPDIIPIGTAWRHKKLRAGAGAALDTSSHHFHLLRYLAGEIDEVGGVTGRFEPMRRSRDELGRTVQETENEVEDQALAILKYSNGAIGVYGDGWGGHGDPCSFGEGLNLFGSQGSLKRVHGALEIAWDDGRRAQVSDLFRYHAPDELKAKCFPMGLTPSAGERYDFAIELHDFLQAIADGQQSETSGWEGLKDIAVCYALIESAWFSRFLRVEDVLNGGVEGYQKEINNYYGL